MDTHTRQKARCRSHDLDLWREFCVWDGIYHSSTEYRRPNPDDYTCQSNFKYYEGQNIVRDNDDIVIVTLNYRTNIFGQPNAPQLAGSSQSQNFGLLDRQAAINWVHTNIAAFGGDPNRIVLFGESAGSISADAYTYANPGDTIVKGDCWLDSLS